MTKRKTHAPEFKAKAVLEPMAGGSTIDDVCAALSIARGTAKAHCEHIYSKVGVRSKAQLVQMIEGMG